MPMAHNIVHIEYCSKCSAGDKVFDLAGPYPN